MMFLLINNILIILDLLATQASLLASLVTKQISFLQSKPFFPFQTTTCCQAVFPQRYATSACLTPISPQCTKVHVPMTVVEGEILPAGFLKVQCLLPASLFCGEPQGCILGPTSFVLYYYLLLLMRGEASPFFSVNNAHISSLTSRPSSSFRPLEFSSGSQIFNDLFEMNTLFVLVPRDKTWLSASTPSFPSLHFLF